MENGNGSEEQHYLYFLWVYIAGRYYVKIGISNGPLQRFDQLLSGIPEPIGFAIFFPGTRTAVKNGESLLHKRYKDYRRSGEWFRGHLSSSLDLFADMTGLFVFWKTEWKNNRFKFTLYLPEKRGRVARMEDTGSDIVWNAMIRLIESVAVDMDCSDNLASENESFDLFRYQMPMAIQEETRS